MVRVSEKAFVRIDDGRIVVFCEFLDDCRVGVSVDGRSEVMDRKKWRELPLAR